MTRREGEGGKWWWWEERRVSIPLLLCLLWCLVERVFFSFIYCSIVSVYNIYLPDPTEFVFHRNEQKGRGRQKVDARPNETSSHPSLSVSFPCRLLSLTASPEALTEARSTSSETLKKPDPAEGIVRERGERAPKQTVARPETLVFHKLVSLCWGITSASEALADAMFLLIATYLPLSPAPSRIKAISGLPFKERFCSFLRELVVPTFLR